MKNDLFMNSESGLSLLTTMVLLLPLIAMMLKRSTWHLSFLALGSCYSLFFLSSLIINGFIPASEKTSHILLSFSTMFQHPLMLLFMTYFARQEEIKKALQYSLIILLLIGIIILTKNDIGTNARPVVLGLGLLLVLIYSSLFFMQQIKSSITQRTETGKAFMISSILFAYSCYSVIFLIKYVFRSTNTEDLFTLYEMSTFISTILLIIGIFTNRKVKQKTEEISIPVTPQLTEWEEYGSFK